MKYVGLGKKSSTFKSKLTRRSSSISSKNNYYFKNNTLNGNRVPDFFMNNLEKIVGCLFLILLVGGLYVK